MTTIQISGRLTKDPEQKTVGQGYLANFGVAVDQFKKGEKTTMFYDCTAWGGLSNTIAQHFHKGDGIVVAGNLHVVEKEGRTYLNIDVTNFGFGAKAKKDSGAQTAAPQLGDEVPW